MSAISGGGMVPQSLAGAMGASQRPEINGNSKTDAAAQRNAAIDQNRFSQRVTEDTQEANSLADRDADGRQAWGGGSGTGDGTAPNPEHAQTDITQPSPPARSLDVDGVRGGSLDMEA